jgi:Methane oxygenase PmoA
MMPTGSVLKPLRAAILAAACLTFNAARALAADTSGVQITREADVLKVTINGQPFTEYHFKVVPRPYFYPLLGPAGLPMTRNWPMKETDDEQHDHPHHRSLWFAHGAVNGHDFWGEEKDFGKIVHMDFDEIKSGPDFGVIRSHDKWVMPDGSIACTDERVMRIYNRLDDSRMFDFEVTIHAANGDVTFGDTKEGSMALRLAETMRLKQPKGPGKGHIVNSEGVRDDATWGKRANWVDYYGPVEGKTLGVAIFDHPANPRHPTTWHVRDYGLFAANPFGLHDFEKKPAGAGDFKIAAGQSATFRYRFYLHNGDEKEARVAEEYEKYARIVSTKAK